MFLRWFPKLKAKLEYSKANFANADVFLIADKNFHEIFTFVRACELPSTDCKATFVLFVKLILVKQFLSDFDINAIRKTFIYHKERYVVTDNQVVKVSGIPDRSSQDYLTVKTRENVASKQLIFGQNSTLVKVTPLYKIFMDEILSPFYFFQLFSIIIWFNVEYMVYPSCIIAVTGKINTLCIADSNYDPNYLLRKSLALSIIMILYQIRKEQVKLAKLSRANETQQVYVGEDLIAKQELVVGDLITITENMMIPADCLLLSGQVRVNEATMTGESAAATKVPVEVGDNVLDFDKNRANVLYSGTQTLTVQDNPRALIIRTGFNTAKGQLIKAIMYPSKPNASYEKDGAKIIGVMALLGLLGFTFSVVVSVNFCLTTGDIILKACDLITIIVPPALPAALTVGIVYAQSRLKKVKIFTTQPKKGFSFVFSWLITAK